jgi:hypothetical protein
MLKHREGGGWVGGGCDSPGERPGELVGRDERVAATSSSPAPAAAAVPTLEAEDEIRVQDGDAAAVAAYRTPPATSSSRTRAHHLRSHCGKISRRIEGT